nr:lipase member K-like [Halyomorpha halys]
MRGGYKATNYEVITEDGYSLWLHRIGNNSGPPVLMQHGVMVAAEQWITRGPNRDLAFFLLKEGYDVWLSNLRGTAFNEYSIKYSKSDRRFWDFSLQENGMYDLPAFIDTILDIRKLNQLYYIGHSQGTAVFFVMCSTKPEYNDKIRGAVLMSPIAYTPAVAKQAPSIRIIATRAEFINRVLRNLGIYSLGIRTEQTINFLRETCVNNESTRVLCLDLLGLSSGEDRNNLNIDEWNFFVPYYGAGTSLYVVLQFAQFYTTGEFKALDLGPIANLEKYGSVKPPPYNLKLVTAPTALIWGNNDVLTSESSVKRLASDLQNVLIVKAVPDPKFNHVDMYIGDNAPYILYPDIIQIINSMGENKSSSEIWKNLKSPINTITQESYSYPKKNPVIKEEKKLLALTVRLTKLYSQQNPSSNLKKLFGLETTDDEYYYED